MTETMHTAWRRERFREAWDPFFYYFLSIRRPYITFKLPRGDMDTPPRLRNFFRYLAIGMCHFRYLWNGLCDRHRAEITVMQFTGHFLPVHHFFFYGTVIIFCYLVSYCEPRCILHGTSSGLHPVSSHSCRMYVLAGRPAFARFMWGSIGVHPLWDRPCFSRSVLHVWFV